MAGTSGFMHLGVCSMKTCCVCGAEYVFGGGEFKSVQVTSGSQYLRREQGGQDPGGWVKNTSSFGGILNCLFHSEHFEDTQVGGENHRMTAEVVCEYRDSHDCQPCKEAAVQAHWQHCCPPLA